MLVPEAVACTVPGQAPVALPMVTGAATSRPSGSSSIRSRLRVSGVALAFPRVMVRTLVPLTATLVGAKALARVGAVGTMPKLRPLALLVTRVMLCVPSIAPSKVPSRFSPVLLQPVGKAALMPVAVVVSTRV